MVPQALRVIAAPVSPAHMKRRMELIRTVDFSPTSGRCGRRRWPSPASRTSIARSRSSSRGGTWSCLPGTEHVVLDRTGHMGTVTRPVEFASIVASFVSRTDAQPRCGARLQDGGLDGADSGVRPSWARGPARSAARRAGPAAGGAPRAAVVFAHPHPQQGGTMHTKAVYRATKALSRHRLLRAAVQLSRRRHQRGRVGRGPRRARGLPRRRSTTWPRAIPGSELWAAGFSFGAWIALTEGALDNRVSVLIGIAPAISMYDFSALKASTKPKFIIHGERDELFPLKAMYAFYGQLQEPKELVVDRRRRPSVRRQGVGGRRGGRGSAGRLQDADELIGVGPARLSGSGRKACHRRNSCDG